MTNSPERAEDLLYAQLRGDRPDPRPDDRPFSLTFGTATGRCRTDRGVLLPDPAYPGTHWHCSERLAGLYRAAYITVHEALSASASNRVMMHAATVARLRTILQDAGEQAIRADGEIYVPDDTPGQASLVEDFLRLERACLGDLADLGHRDALVQVAEIAEGCVGSGLPHFSVMAHGIRLFLCGSGFHPVHRPGALARARALGLAAHRDAARLVAVSDEAEEADAQVIAEDRGGIVRLPVSAPAPKAPGRGGRTLVVFPRLDHLPQPNKLARERADSPRALCEDLVEVPLPLAPTPDPAVFAAALREAFPWADEVTEQYALDLVGAPFAMVLMPE
ncbi:hypothetical protein [Methylobacterium sp. J-070]|uniref:hypothetical protein n=1 Tax=Methylobacterium sp. J-070 TaxID=2836650 RepID=UPI001FB964D3|nr:hypothetical protein [Methylobacterium sp. J-070]MCJ2053557.1 hypothetical protein [Methylobacterium sp. J-070]